MANTSKKPSSAKKHTIDSKLAKSRPSKEELKAVTKKTINQYRDAIKNLARR